MADDSDAFFRSIFKGGSIIFVGFILEMGISFLGKIVVARWLNRTDFGAVAIGSTLLSTMLAFVLLGMNTGVARYLPRFEDEAHRRGVLVSAFQIVVPVSVAVAAGWFVLAEPIATRLFQSRELIPVLRVFALSLPFFVATELVLGAVQGFQRTLPKVYIQNLGTPILRFALIVVAITLGAHAVGIAWAYALARIVPALAALYFLYRLTPFFSGSEYVPMRRELLAFSVPLVVSSAMGRVLADLDTYLLGYYLNLETVGVYNAIYPLVTATGFALSAFGYLTMPIISELHSKGQRDGMADLYRGVSKWIVLLTLPLFAGIILFPRVVIASTFGAKYLSGAAALQLLIVGYVASTITGTNIQILISIGESRMHMYFNVIAAAVNVVLNVVLIPRYELLGAAAATVVSLVLLEVLVSVRLYQRTGLHPFSRSLVLPAAFGVAVVGALYPVFVTLFGVSLLSAVALFVAFTPVYLVGIVWFGGVEEQEMMIIESIEDRFGIDFEPVKRIARRLM
jgi:O-antigen/teichoic acid export membrane protein